MRRIFAMYAFAAREPFTRRFNFRFREELRFRVRLLLALAARFFFRRRLNMDFPENPAMDAGANVTACAACVC
jgi:hypothetical protein